MHLRILSLFLLLFTAIPSGFSQSAGRGRDTVFLFRDGQTNSGNVVYLEPDLRTATRKRLLDFSISALDSEVLESNYAAALSDTPAQDSHCLPAPQYLHRLAQNWLPVYSYKGRYHLYAPCDRGREYRMMVQPTRLLRFYMDGPALDLLQSVSKTGPKTYKLTTYVCGPEGRDPSLIYIHLLGKNGQLAVWEFMGEADSTRYELRATPAGAANFPLIVEACPDVKAGEWDGFDRIDFQKLLRNRP